MNVQPRINVFGFISAAIALAVTSLTGTAAAQELRVGGGVGLPVQPSEFTDLYNLGFHAGMELGGRLGKQKRTTLALAIYHHRFPLDSEGVRDVWRRQGVPDSTPYEISGGTYVLTEIYLAAKQDIGQSSVRPFILGGLGVGVSDITLLKLRLGDQRTEASKSAETDPMGTLGFGVDVPAGPIRVFGQVRLSLVFTEGDNTILVPVTAGVAF